MSTEQASTSTRRWIGQAVTSLLLAGGVLMPYAPWLVPNGLARVAVMVVLLAAGLLVYAVAIRRAGPEHAGAPAPTASRLIIVGVVGLSVLSSLVIESIHAPLWFALLVVVAALLLLAFRLDARPRVTDRR